MITFFESSEREGAAAPPHKHEESGRAASSPLRGLAFMRGTSPLPLFRKGSPHAFGMHASRCSSSSLTFQLMSSSMCWSFSPSKLHFKETISRVLAVSAFWLYQHILLAVSASLANELPPLRQKGNRKEGQHLLCLRWPVGGRARPLRSLWILEARFGVNEECGRVGC